MGSNSFLALDTKSPSPVHCYSIMDCDLLPLASDFYFTNGALGHALSHLGLGLLFPDTTRSGL